ncbi:MAG: prolyl oligopeptidase family serine peptidase [Actinomycetota bacterium]|nr:prolyl oligopeptidase family serine peptidase [Actinomycetota bacterium]
MAPISAEQCIGGRDLTEPRLSADGSLLVHAVAHDGAAWLVLHHLDGGHQQVLANAPGLRAGRGMGGGAWCFTAAGDAVVYVGVDGNLWLQSLTGAPPRALTDHGPDRSATGPTAAPDGSSVVYVLDLAEVHRVRLADLSTTRLDDGNADFCMDPFVEADSLSVRWHAWDVPDMPWDRSRVQRIDAEGHVSVVLDGGGAVQQPRVMPDGTPTSVRDDSGWLNVHVGDRAVVAEPFEHAGPSWGPGQCSYAWSPDARSLAYTRNESGFGRLCVADLAGGVTREVARGVHGQLSWQGTRLAALRTGARTPTQVVVYDTATWERSVVAVGPAAGFTPDALPEPELVEVAAIDGVVHARLYRAAESDGRLIVWLHGGPTDQWQVTFMPRFAYWLSRGWSILVPDHRGSTGHGRAYQQALRERWGELDVGDTLAVVRHAHDAGWARPSHTVVMGSSAGGFTALGAVAADPDAFAAAVVLYPVTDLADLAERSHRFERHYTVSLVGPLPDALPRYRERSPILHTGRLRRTPLLVLHGDGDAVVPVQQSRVFAQRVATSGGQVELHVYEGEGHGFRQAVNQLDEYRRVEGFLARCVPVASRS